MTHEDILKKICNTIDDIDNGRIEDNATKALVDLYDWIKENSQEIKEKEHYQKRHSTITSSYINK